MDLYRRAAIFENQSGGGLRINGCVYALPKIRGSKAWRSIVSHLRGRRFRRVIRWRLVNITGLLRAGLGSACVVLASVGKPAVCHWETIAKRIQPGISRVSVRGMVTILHATPAIVRPVGRRVCSFVNG